MAKENIRLKIGNLAKAVLITGQAYQDPKDALNEFVSNAADEYAQAGKRGERIRIFLHRRGRYPLIAVEDNGGGMSPDRLREVARNLFESSKAGDHRTIGEKAIGLLAFQQLGGKCDIVSKAAITEKTATLHLIRGKATAQLDLNERRRARAEPGTTVYISDLDPEVLRVLTQRKVVDYLRSRRGPALASGDYSLEVIEGRKSEVVTPEQPDGIRLNIPVHPTLWGRIEFGLYVAATADKKRRVAVVGTGGTTIIDDISEIEEFDKPPWTSDHVAGQIVFAGLKQSAGRRAVLRDRDSFPIFVDAIKSIEPAVIRTLEGVVREVDLAVADRLADVVRRIFGRVLKELADIENPMRTPMGTLDGQGGLLAEPQSEPNPKGHNDSPGGPSEPPDLDDLLPDETVEQQSESATQEARPAGGRSRSLPSLVPDPSPDGARSRFDDQSGIVYYNDQHPDYLLVKHDETALLDYLATLVAKEYVVFNNPRSSGEELAEEMVRMLVRVRRHMPIRLQRR